MLRIVVGLLLLISSQADAYFGTNGKEVTQPGETIYNSKEIVICNLVKSSFKGGSRSFFGLGNKTTKSAESYCHTRSGGTFAFSANAEQLDHLKHHAGRDVLVYLSSQKKLENAQTDWVMLDIKPVDRMKEIEYKTVCGPPIGKQLYEDQEAWSRGFRVAQVYFSNHTEQGWMLSLLEGNRSNDIWGEEIPVQLGRFCNAHLHDAMNLNQPLVYHYVQLKEAGPYYIESIHRILFVEEN